MRNSVWKVIEDSAELGKRAIIFVTWSSFKTFDHRE